MDEYFLLIKFWAKNFNKWSIFIVIKIWFAKKLWTNLNIHSSINIEELHKANITEL